MTLVATALCADRVVVSAPALRPDATAAARTLVGRLTVSFRRSVSVARVYQDRCDQDRAVVTPVVLTGPAVVRPFPLSPFQFRLPPPARA